MTEYYKEFPVTMYDPILEEDVEVKCWFYFHPAQYEYNPSVDIVEIRWEGNSVVGEMSESQIRYIKGVLLEAILAGQEFS